MMSGSRPTGSLAEYFDLALLINLPHRQDRLRSAQKEFERVGWAIGEGGVQVFPAVSFEDAGGFPSPGARGCFYSHLECLKRAAREGKQRVLMCEDDLALSSAIPRLTSSIVSTLRQEAWDFVYFGHEDTGPIGAADAETSEIRFLPYSDTLITTHFYAVNGRIIPRLIEHLELIASGAHSDRGLVRMPVDGGYNTFRAMHPDVRALIAAPKLGWQRPSRSDVTPGSFDVLRPLHPVTSLLRDVKHWLTRRHR